MTKTRRVLNWKRAREVAREDGVQLGQDALVLLEGAAEKTIRKASERTKTLGRHRITEGVLRGTLDIE